MTKILTIDQGTTSSRSIVFDSNAEIIELSQKEYPLIYPNDGWVEIDPSALIKSVTDTLKNIDLKDISSAAITNQRETTLVWDRKSGKPIYNAIVWQDRRTESFCSSIEDNETLKEISERTGLLLDPYFSATKIKWILENVKDAKVKAKEGSLCFGTVDTYLMYVLSKGRIYKTDITNASRTMLFNINTLSWDRYLLDLFEIPESMLPEVSNSDESFGPLSECNNINVNAVLGDQQAALFGQGCLNAGDLKSTYGTGCFLMSNVGSEPLTPKKGLLTTVGFSFNKQIHYAVEGSIYSAGTVIQWLRDNLKFFKESSESEKFLNSDANANGVHFIPAFTGLGAPYWDSNIRASFHGITRDTTKKDLINAAFNSISYQTKDIVDCLEQADISVKSLSIDGGMAANKTFVSHIANILNIPIQVPKNTESTAKGVACLAGITTGLMNIDLLEKQEKNVFNPNSNYSKIMDSDYRLWKQLINENISS
tara:strand:+ start:4902 stop:6347 length:1446 start_codon:yes stop_codon:yes gene_type:complete